jgi:hypothetical protein
VTLWSSTEGATRARSKLLNGPLKFQAKLPHVDAVGCPPPATAPDGAALSLRRFRVPAGLLALAGTGYLAFQWWDRPGEIAVADPAASAVRAAPPPAGADVAVPVAPSASLPALVAAAASEVGIAARQPRVVPSVASTRSDKPAASKAPAPGTGVASVPPRATGSSKPADLAHRVTAGRLPERSVALGVAAAKKELEHGQLAVVLPHARLDHELPAADAQHVAQRRGHRVAVPERRHLDPGAAHPGLIVRRKHRDDPDLLLIHGGRSFGRCTCCLQRTAGTRAFKP